MEKITVTCMVQEIPFNGYKNHYHTARSSNCTIHFMHYKDCLRIEQHTKVWDETKQSVEYAVSTSMFNL